MKIEIVKVPSGKFCFHAACKKEARYVTPKGRIRKGTTAAQISHKANGGKSGHRYVKELHFYYCRSCIDQLLHDCRVNLDAKLWIFK